MADGDKLADVAKMSFEDALEELEDIVRTLEDGKGKLEDAITAYERGTKTKGPLREKLKAAQAKVEAISLSADGEVTAEPAVIE